MAARRLLIIMVVLLAISTLAAALVPPPQERGDTSTSSTATTTRERTIDRQQPSELVRAEVSIPGRNRAPSEVRARAGDQLALIVTSRRPGEASIPEFGLIEFAGPGNAASFDLLIEEAGEFPVRFGGSGQVATIVAREGGRAEPSTAGTRARGE